MQAISVQVATARAASGTTMRITLPRADGDEGATGTGPAPHLAAMEGRA